MSEARKARSRTDPVIPDKLYFRIGEVARLIEVEAHTLRFWESEFPQLRINKGGTGQRLYRRKDVELALEIKQLLYSEGYTIPGARQLLQARSRRKDAPELPFPNTAAQAPAAKAPAAKAAASTDGETPLLRMRAELRAISEMLARPLAAPFATEHDRSNAPRALPGSRRGLYLASRRAHDKPRAQDLFGSTND